MTTKPTTAQKAYAVYIKEYSARPTPAYTRKMELVRELAKRRPSNTPNLPYRLAIASRFIRIYGIK